MFNLIIPTAAIRTESGEARILDTDLAQWLGMSMPTNIRTTIVEHFDELAGYGNLHPIRVNSGQRGRPGAAYHLNEAQALVLCALSRTSKAAQVRKALIDLFKAFREGKIVDVKAHKRRAPSRQQPGRRYADPALESQYNLDYDFHLGGLQAIKGNGDALLSVIAGLMSRIDTLERERF